MAGEPNEKTLDSQSPSLAASEETSGAEVRTPPPDSAEKNLEAAVQKLQAEKQQLFDQLLRKQADVENFRKRIDREKEEFLQYTLLHAVKSLLPVLDGFELALGSEGSGGDYRKGVEMIYKQLCGVLQKLGLEPVEAKGREFDPRFHEAVATFETEQYRDQEIVDELQRGYLFKQRLLRPAMVRVAKRPAAGNDTKQNDASPE